MDLAAIESQFEPTADRKCAVAEGGMVATAFPDATQAGVEILRQGGNAVDAACASALAIGVCEPQASGVGGQSMAILHTQGKTVAIDGSSRAPSLAHIDRFNKDNYLLGYKATTVPSTVAVLGYLNKRYGRLDWPSIVQPAIRIAREGYKITQLQHDFQVRDLEKFMAVPSRSGAHYFLKDGIAPYAVGDLFVQSDLANLLEHLAEHGPRSFYRSEIRKRIDEDMRANDGFLRKDDLALVPWPIERKPIGRRYREIMVHTIPPPAAGRVLLLVLMILDQIPAKFLQSHTPESYHYIAEAFRKSFLQRRERPFDPNTYPQEQNKKMLSWAFAKKQAKSIHDTIDIELPLGEPPEIASDTTHLSVMDNEGTAIGITQSIELVYGSKAAAQGLGFLYNNYISAFETRAANHPYYLRPNGIPWTSVAPAIVTYKRQPWMVLGSPGSERIYSTVGQFLMHMVDGKHPMSEAMTHPRLHCSIGGTISLEADRFDLDVIEYLGNMGYTIDRRESFSFYHGAIHAVMKCLSRPGFQGVAEIRRDGTAEGI
ncbi:MAG: gamma-glutamyltransferase [Acidobacteriota bacterium]|jgi:gamma-glutamyltranspeptidase/glutathione hydrolase